MNRQSSYTSTLWGLFASCGIVLMLLSMSFFSSCSKKVGPTSIEIEDSLRHYYPLLQGQELEIQWRIANTGDIPLVFTDIQPSCGCVTVDDNENNIILPHKEGKLKFKFYSGKNTGYVRHTIRLFGNIATSGIAELVFDVNVVPPYNGSPDYEDYYNENREKIDDIKDLINGKANERGYWTDEEHYSTGHKRYFWKKDDDKAQ